MNTEIRIAYDEGCSVLFRCDTEFRFVKGDTISVQFLDKEATPMVSEKKMDDFYEHMDAEGMKVFVRVSDPVYDPLKGLTQIVNCYTVMDHY